MSEPVIAPYLSYRVIDRVTGNVLIPILRHPHKSRWTIRGFQPGSVSHSSVGDFEIPLFGTLTKEYAESYQDMLALKYGARIEGFLNLGESASETQGGDPLVTGIITEIEWGPNQSHIRGFDSIYLASQAKTLKTEFVSDTSRPGQIGSSSRTDNLIIAEGQQDSGTLSVLYDYGLTYGDDFSGANPLASYANDGAWALTTDEGLNVVSLTGGNGAGDGQLRTNTSFTLDNYTDGVIDAVFHLQPTNPGDNSSGTAVGEAGVVAAATDVNNLILCRVLVIYNGKAAPRRYEASVELYQKVGGTYTLMSSKPQVLTFPISQTDMRLQVALTSKVQKTTSSLYQVTWKAIVNGTDSGCFFTQTVSSLTGSVGLRNYYATSYGKVFASQLVFISRARIFQQGLLGRGVAAIAQTFSRSSMLDLWNFISVLEGWIWRKNPKAGLNNDTIDFGYTAITAPPDAAKAQSWTYNDLFANNGTGQNSDVASFNITGWNAPQGRALFLVCTVTTHVTSVTDSYGVSYLRAGVITTSDGFEVSLWYAVSQQTGANTTVTVHLSPNGRGTATNSQVGDSPSNIPDKLYLIDVVGVTGTGTAISLSVNNSPVSPNGNLMVLAAGYKGAGGFPATATGDLTVGEVGGVGNTENIIAANGWKYSDSVAGYRPGGITLSASQNWAALLATFASIPNPFPLIGTDYSSSIVFEEEKNISDWSLTTNAEYFATDIELASSPSSDSAGTVSWKNLTAIRLYGFLSDIVQATGLGDLLSLRKHAQQISLKSGVPGQAKTIKIKIDPETAFKFREMDYVGLLIRSQQMINQRVLVLGYTFTEGGPEMDLLLDQFTFDIGYRNLRNRRNLDAIEAQTGAGPRITTGTFYNPIDASQGSPVMFSPTSSTGNSTVTSWTFKFFIPTNLQVLQKVFFVISAYGSNAGVSSFTVDGTAFNVSDTTGAPWSGINDSQETDITNILAGAGFNNGGWHTVVVTTTNAVKMQTQAHVIGVVKGT